MGKKKSNSTNETRESTAGGVSGKRNVLATKNTVNVADSLRTGRHECRCQARVHELILNCLGCGRIVCAQEGSGPCFSCGTLVCTREEREILNRGSRKSAELLSQLTSDTGTKLAGVTKSLKDATTFRNKLLEADADTERRTRVNDLQSEYTNEEKSSFLTAEERESLMRRREELRALRQKQRNAFVVSIDIESNTVQQMKNMGLTDSEIGNDPVIRRIIESGDERRRAEEAAFNSASDARWTPKGFVPKYAEEYGRKNGEDDDNAVTIDSGSMIVVSEALAAQATEEAGIAMAVSQPAATFLVHGIIKFIRWSDDVTIKGPVFITATAEQTDEAKIGDFAKKYVRDKPKMEQLDFSTGSVLGRAFLKDCLTLEEFYEQYGSKSVIPESGDYVLCFNAFEPLVSAVPHIPTGSVYELDKFLKKTLTGY